VLPLGTGGSDTLGRSRPSPPQAEVVFLIGALLSFLGN
jgi:hypothetical protein